jgi:3-hydroxyisobutyrate dehydrogenase
MLHDDKVESATLFVGLGKMGEPMVRRYAPTRSTLVYDASDATASRIAADLGVTQLSNLDELPDGVDTVILMLPNSTIVESVLLGANSTEGILAKLPSGALVIDMGSSRPASTRMLAERAQERGIDLVDAPVSGGVAKAAAGTLSIMLGGSATGIARAKAHVSPLGAHFLELGPAGTGHAAKALNNWLSAANLSAAAEILSIAVQNGIVPEAMIDTLNASTGRSQATEVKYPNHILSGSFDSGFDFDLMLKDLRIGSDLAGEQATFSPILEAVLGSVEDARAWFGRNDLDHTEMARFYEEKNAVTFRQAASEAAS